MSGRTLTIAAGIGWASLFTLLALGQDAGSSCIDDRGCGVAGELVWIGSLVLLPAAVIVTVAAVVATAREVRRSRSD